MPIAKRSKIRADVLKVMDEFQKIQTRGVFKYLRINKESDFDFLSLWKKVMRANNQFFNRKKEKEELFSLLSREEMRFLAMVLRYSFDFTAKINEKKYPIPEDVKIETTDAGGVPAEWQIAPDAVKDRVLLYIHGGGFVLGSPCSHRLFTVRLGQATKMRVLSIDYRLSPENPHPAASEDCVTAYNWLISIGIKPENIIIAGDSAGGNLTLVTLIKLRNNGIFLPAGGIALSPVTDLTATDDCWFQNAETDPILADIGIFWWLPAYLLEGAPSDPYVSPLFAELDGLPPVLLQVSTCEILYSDSVRFVEKAKASGVNATLQEWDDMMHVFPHIGLYELPEAEEAINKIAEFIQKLFS